MALVTSKQAKSIADDFYEFSISNTALSINIGNKTHFYIPKLTLENSEISAVYAKEIINRINAIANPSHEDSVLLESIKFACVELINEEKYYWNKIDVAPWASIVPSIKSFLADYKIEDKSDLQRYFDYLGSYINYLEDLRNKTKDQINMGIILPRQSIAFVINEYKNYQENIKSSPLLITENKMSFFSKEIADYLDISIELINRINLALISIIDLLGGEYLENAPHAFGYYNYQNGKSFYKMKLNSHATINITPEEVFETGERIKESTLRRMGEIRRILGYQCNREEFINRLVDHPNWKIPNSEEFGNQINNYASTINEYLQDYFIYVPSTPCKAERLSSNLEQTFANGFYLPPNDINQMGIYYYNGLDIEKKNPLKTAPLAFHELLPGHHYQISYIFENEELHPFQKIVLLSANCEGWAEYASKLVGEMKIGDPLYYEYGKLEMDLYLTTLMLVDVGVNYFEWSFEKAVDYLRPFLIEFSEERLINQVMSIILAEPGFVCSYKIGSLIFDELREKAENLLKEKFDIREFNHTLIEWGSLPLQVLKQHVDWYIEKKLLNSNAVGT